MNPDTLTRELPPQDVEAEQAVLGAMLLSKDAIGEVVALVRSADFYRPAHQTVFDAVVELYGQDQPADPMTVKDELTRTGDLLRVGGADYLHTLIAAVPTVANAGYYAEIVADKALLRRTRDELVRGLQRVAQAAAGGVSGDEARQVLAAIQDALYTVYNPRAGSDYTHVADLFAPALDVLNAAMDGQEDTTALYTGFAELDAILGGLRPGQLVIIGARPAVGKSTLGLDIARHVSIKGRTRYNAVTRERTVTRAGSLFCSLEMSKPEIILKILAAQAKVQLQALRTGTLTDDDLVRIFRQADPLEEAPMWVDDTPGMTIPEVGAKARRLQRTQGLGLLIVDYLQLFTSAGKVESRQTEVATFSRQLKLLAKDLGIPVIAMSQLNRDVERRSDKKPGLADLRESGAIEADADVVILLDREDTRDPQGPRAGEADFIVAKNRNGPTFTCTVAFQGHYSRFVDMRDDHPSTGAAT